MYKSPVQSSGDHGTYWGAGGGASYGIVGGMSRNDRDGAGAPYDNDSIGGIGGLPNSTPSGAGGFGGGGGGSMDQAGGGGGYVGGDVPRYSSSNSPTRRYGGKGGSSRNNGTSISFTRYNGSGGFVIIELIEVIFSDVDKALIAAFELSLIHI